MLLCRCCGRIRSVGLAKSVATPQPPQPYRARPLDNVHHTRTHRSTLSDHKLRFVTAIHYDAHEPIRSRTPHHTPTPDSSCVPHRPKVRHTTQHTHTSSCLAKEKVASVHLAHSHTRTHTHTLTHTTRTHTICNMYVVALLLRHTHTHSCSGGILLCVSTVCTVYAYSA